MDNSGFEIPEQLLATLRILNLDPDNLRWMLTQNKQGFFFKISLGNRSQMDAYSKQTRGFIEISLGKPTSTAHSDPKPIPRPIIANHLDRCDIDGAKLHFAEKQMKLTESEENEKPLLAARTTARRKGNPNMEKRILKAKSPGKKFRDQRRLNQFNAKRRLSIVGLCSHR